MNESVLYDADNNPYYLKAPAAILDYGIDLAAEGWLAAGETISTTPGDVTTTVTSPASIVSTTLLNANTAIACWVSGGTIGSTLLLVITFKTTAGRVDTRTLRLKVVAR